MLHLTIRPYRTGDGYQVICDEQLGCSSEGKDLTSVLIEVAQALANTNGTAKVKEITC